MAERTLVFQSDADLEQALRDLGQHVAYPPTPDLVAGVQARLVSTDGLARTDARVARVPAARISRERWWGWLTPWPRAVALGVVALAVLVGLGVLASPEARRAVADRLGIGGVSVTHVEEVPTAVPPEPTPTPAATPQPTMTPPPPGAALNLGTRVTLEQAQARFGTSVLLPELGPPDAVYVNGDNEVSLVYAPRPDLPASTQTRGVGVLLTQFRAAIDASMMGQKGISQGTNVEQVQVSGVRGLWISGAPHLFLRHPNGALRDVPARLAANTLLWEMNGVTYRLESALDRAAAVRIAESLR